MKKHRLLIQAIMVLALATVVNVTSTNHLAGEAPRGAPFPCAACFTEDGRCEGNEDEACGDACGTWAVGECQEYDPLDVSCNTTLQVYDYVECF